MIPNMFKSRGRADAHGPSTSRPGRVATHALSIYGDHSDVMHARAALGDARRRLGPGGPRLALVAATAATLPVADLLHSSDGFRTSHEINKIALIDEDVIRSLIRDDDVLAFRADA